MSSHNAAGAKRERWPTFVVAITTSAAPQGLWLEPPESRHRPAPCRRLSVAPADGPSPGKMAACRIAAVVSGR